MTEQLPLRAEDVLDALAAHVAVVSADGVIAAVNRSWTEFCERNGGDPQATGVGTNYFGVCRSQEANDVYDAMQLVLKGEVPMVETEYRCDSPTEERWFMLQVTPCYISGDRGLMVAHTNITFRRKKQRELQEAADMERREWEIASLTRLTAPSAAQSTGSTFGFTSLAVALPDVINAATRQYMELVQNAFDSRVYRREVRQSEEIRVLASDLGRLGASPRELVSIHCDALRRLMANVPVAKAGVYQEEGRLVLLEAMGYLATHYRMSASSSRGRATAGEG